MSTSSFNLGIASATWLAAQTILTRLGLAGPAIVGCGLAVLALLALLGMNLETRMRTGSGAEEQYQPVDLRRRAFLIGWLANRCVQWR